MGNINLTRLTCSDLQRFKKIVKDVLFKNLETEFIDGMVFITTQNTLPYKEIMELSKQNPDLTFFAEYNFEHEKNGTLHVWQYNSGVEIGEVLEPQYTLSSKGDDNMEDDKRMMGICFDKLFNKAIQIFRRIDITKEDEKGNKFIDFVSGITLTVEDDNYQMQLSKSHSDIEVKCFEKEEVITIKLVPVGTLSPF